MNTNKKKQKGNFFFTDVRDPTQHFKSLKPQQQLHAAGIRMMLTQLNTLSIAPLAPDHASGGCQQFLVAIDIH